MGEIDRDYADNRVRKTERISTMARIIEDTKRFLKEVRIEMAKVTWPTKTELKGSTVLVILVSVFFAVYIAGIDLILTNFINLF